MTADQAVACAVQVGGGVAAAPLLSGLVQHWKARLQGRRGPSPLQPYRELRRLWGKSVVAIDGTTALYRIAPAVAAAATATAVLLVPVSAATGDLGVGHDLLAFVAILGLARFVIVLSAWDTGSGFSLMGVSRDLTIAAFVELALLLSLAVAALIGGTTDLTAIVAATAGTEPWRSPALPLAAVAIALVLIAETGRQPIDNPDTHLELTMIHEGPLLEYAGRDLAMLQWVAAARHWLFLVLIAQVFAPHVISPRGQLATLPLVLLLGCAGLALAETLVAKMRILLAPRLIGVGAAAALLGIAAWLVEGG
jgi:formate hydrogenlyase subunit 4